MAIKIKEKLEPNVVEPTLFVGVGGIGSKIIKGVADLCLNDKVDNIRFVVLDTDVNDLTRLENGSVITTIQTSSTRSIKDYLDFDTDARDHWFPKNRILDSKTVSEGAGQVRAISRLALNATIKQGTIMNLYSQIDDLYLKDGGDKSRAIKVIIASTVAGGTGSGIALEAAMIIRDYLSRNYPESAAIIRGFFIMPGVMDTVIQTESERQSIRRNGYATIKEINAFMMKGSGFFDSNPELQRYKDLCLTVPSTNGPSRDIDNLPFDFCFLLDRIDGKQHSMKSLPQYLKFASQSIYEQNIGPMRGSASSKEDNIVKEFIVPEKLGRCRFGGAGASVLRYPYAKLVEYVALNRAKNEIIGKLPDNATEEMKKAAVANSWLKYDKKFKEDKTAWENDVNSSEKNRPYIEKSYVDQIDSAENDDYTETIKKELRAKCASNDKNASAANFKNDMDSTIESFITSVVDHIVDLVETDIVKDNVTINAARSSQPSDKENVTTRYQAIEQVEVINESLALVDEMVKNFINNSFRNKNSILKDVSEAYALESLFKNRDKVLHPNATRYLLYKLQAALDKKANEYQNNSDKERYDNELDKVKFGDTDDKGKRDIKGFQVGLNLGKEESLEQMCGAIADKNAIQEKFNPGAIENCNELLRKYSNIVVSQYTNYVGYKFCAEAESVVRGLSTEYEKFFDQIEDRFASLEKKKEVLIDELRYRTGDSIVNLFSTKEMLDKVCDDVGKGQSSSKDSSELYGKIFDAIKENAEITKKQKSNSLLRESKKDIFNDAIVAHFEKQAELNTKEKLDLDILHAIKYEFEIDSSLRASKEVNEAKKEEILKYLEEPKNITSYISKMIEKARNLASPGIAKNDFEEPREVNAIAWSDAIKDGGGLKVSDFRQYLDDKNQSKSVSKYELRFFSSVYNVMPTQLSKFAYAGPSNNDEKYSVIRKDSGEYFNAYQLYMEQIGPDSTLNPVITPHIDKRWNSISVMPEIDLKYQRDLMKYIHSAFGYGILYHSLARRPISDYDENEMVYRLIEAGTEHFLIVSNGTPCDELYEVLDALYFDRDAVKRLNTISDKKRSIDEENTTAFEETAFKRAINDLRRNDFVGLEGAVSDKSLKYATSIFEIPVHYYKSLPSKKKDTSEIVSMINAIVEMLRREIETFFPAKDVNSRTSFYVMEQYKLLLKNVEVLPELFPKNLKVIVDLVREGILNKFDEYGIKIPKELEDYDI